MKKRLLIFRKLGLRRGDRMFETEGEYKEAGSRKKKLTRISPYALWLGKGMPRRKYWKTS